MPSVNVPFQKGRYILIDKNDLYLTKNQLDEMFKISHRLFDAYYGEDYYLPISGNQINVYEYLADELIRDLNKRKKNIFYRLWTKIKKLMKW